MRENTKWRKMAVERMNTEYSCSIQTDPNLCIVIKEEQAISFKKQY